ncbi:hypothetical protein GGR55DRAFT_429741 [Xylaria sp. FL0064]|nr:hypothetical protein GGR55DRAFT_429741 [Xylaria sp. FL0064]
MFSLPEAKRVRREDLHDSASDSASSDDEGGQNSQVDLALRAKLQAQLSSILQLNFSARPKTQQQQQPNKPQAEPARDAPKEEEAFAFRLFRDEAPTHTVVLTPDKGPAAQGEGSFVVPSRPRSHYIASAPSPGQTSEYRSVAVTAEYLLADAKKRRWGLEKPWRVIHITPDSAPAVSGKPIPGSEESAEQQKKKRMRPGKKHRILSRVREKEKREREEAAKKLALDKEQHLQDKKKRLNRERKLKRRQKEREKKAGLQTTTSNPNGGGSENGSRKDDDGNARVHSDEEP